MAHRKEKQRKLAARRAEPDALDYERLGQGYYGSGGSYGYGGGFEHPERPESFRPQTVRGADSGWYHGPAPMEPYAALGGFGSAQPGRRAHQVPPPVRAESSDQRGPFFGRTPKGYTRADARIREDVCDQLMYGQVDPSEVSVRVQHGEVILEGRVENRQAKYIVEEIAASVLGVRDVDNRLRVAMLGDPPTA